LMSTVINLWSSFCILILERWRQATVNSLSASSIG
jgi:hypothetical protein